MSMLHLHRHSHERGPPQPQVGHPAVLHVPCLATLDALIRGHKCQSPDMYDESLEDLELAQGLDREAQMWQVPVNWEHHTVLEQLMAVEAKMSEFQPQACEQGVRFWVRCALQSVQGKLQHRAEALNSRGPRVSQAPWLSGSEVSRSPHSISLTSADSEPKCFLEDAVLTQMNGDAVKAEAVIPGMVIRSEDGTPVVAETVQRFGSEDRTLIHLCTSSATHVLTDSHRVLVRRVSGMETAPASALRVGDDVVITGFDVQPLLAVDRLDEIVRVVQITFQPDRAVGSFMPPSAMILTHGHRERGHRRGQHRTWH